MFFQNMIYIGYFGLWVLYNIAFLVYMSNLVKGNTTSQGSKNFGSYVVRIYIVALTNLFIAITLVILPIIAMVAGIHVYWIVVGILYTLVLHLYYTKMFTWGEFVSREESKENVLEVKKGSDNLRILHIIVMGILAVYYILIAFNAFEILPLQKVFLPPIMPLYYHMLLEFVTILGVMLLNTVILYVVRYRIRSKYRD